MGAPLSGIYSKKGFLESTILNHIGERYGRGDDGTGTTTANDDPG